MPTTVDKARGDYYTWKFAQMQGEIDLLRETVSDLRRMLDEARPGPTLPPAPTVYGRLHYSGGRPMQLSGAPGDD